MDRRVGQALNNLRGALLGSSNPAERAAGILVWRAIAIEVFKFQQKPQTYPAISYAIMDTHDYTDISCDVNVRSVEVFFDAADPNLLAFVNRLLLFEIDQEFASGYSVAGYVSLRFCQQSRATIAQEAFPLTCAIECSGLADELGSSQFVDYAVKLALDPNIKGILHWGQQNPSTQADIQFRFGDTPANPTGPLQQWRSVLARLTDNGRLNGFSSDFTRTAGLEIVQPQISSFSISSRRRRPRIRVPLRGTPSATRPRRPSLSKSAHQAEARRRSPICWSSGSQVVVTSQTGSYTLKLVASLERNGETRRASQSIVVAVS